MTTSISRVSIPLLDWQIEISVQNKKILAVAIASILLFGLQMALSWPITFAITFALMGLTYLFERNRTETQDWFQTDFDKRQLLALTSFLILKPFILQILFWSLGIPLPGIPQVELARAIFEHPWRMIPIATLSAPFAEEVLFRGFLLERLQDIAQFCSHYCIHLSKSVQDHLSNAVQAVIFGAIHLRRAVEEGMEMPLLLLLSGMGFLFGLFKKEDNTLISPIAIHSANNIGSVIYIFQSQ